MYPCNRTNFALHPDARISHQCACLQNALLLSKHQGKLSPHPTRWACEWLCWVYTSSLQNWKNMAAVLSRFSNFKHPQKSNHVWCLDLRYPFEGAMMLGSSEDESQQSLQIQNAALGVLKSLCFSDFLASSCQTLLRRISWKQLVGWLRVAMFDRSKDHTNGHKHYLSIIVYLQVMV